MRSGIALDLHAIGPRTAAVLKNLKNRNPLRTLRSLQRRMFGFPIFLGMTRPRQLYFLSTSRAITMRMTSDAPSVIMRLR
jgi:hypothetical protein